MDVKPRILPTHNKALFAHAVSEAKALLEQGELVAIPTETVYGLAANAYESTAVAKIFEVKGRPARNPVIVHVAGIAMAQDCVTGWPESAQKLAHAFWPGPLTMILPRSTRIPDIVTAGGETVGVRWPSHPYVQALILACGFPLAAPSANPSNAISPTNVQHVQRSLGSAVPLVIDGGQSQVGIESTVVDLTCEPARLLRPGMIHAESLLAVLGKLTLGFGDSEEILRSPGQLKKHYSPKARLIVRSWSDEQALVALIEPLREEIITGSPENRPLPFSQIHVIAHTQIPLEGKWGRVSVIPHDAEAFARALYAELHQCDEANAGLIVVETPPEGAEWQAVRDRLERAAAEHGG